MPQARRTTAMDPVQDQRLGVSIPINYDRRDKVFCASFAGTLYEETSYQVLEEALREAIQQSISVRWQDVVVVRMLAPFSPSTTREGAFLGFMPSREHIGQLSSGRWKVVEWENWEAAEPLRWAHDFSWPSRESGIFVPPCVYRPQSDGAVYYLPYSEPLWQRLLQMRDALRLLDSRLAVVHSTADGIAQLLASATGALELPAANPDA